MARRHTKTNPDKGVNKIESLRNQMHRILTYSALISEAADRLHNSHAVLYRHVVRGEHTHVMKSVDPKFVKRIANHLKLALNLAESVERRANDNEKDVEDAIYTIGNDPAEHQHSPTDTQTSDSSSNSEDEDTDVLPCPPWVKAAISSSTQTVKPDTPTDEKALEPPQLIRNDTELAQPSETNQQSPSTTAESVQAVVDQL